MIKKILYNFEVNSLCLLVFCFDREWQKELSKLKEGKQPSLQRALARVIWLPFLLIGLCAFGEVGVTVKYECLKTLNVEFNVCKMKCLCCFTHGSLKVVKIDLF